MERNVSESPEYWVIIKLPDNYYKVFATWIDRWKLNSGISKVEQDKDFYYFIGFSGSCYKCNKKNYGTATFYGFNVLMNIMKQSRCEFEIMKGDNMVLLRQPNTDKL